MQIHKNQNKIQLYLPGYSGSKSRKVSYATTYHRSAQVSVAFPANTTHGRQMQCFELFDTEIAPEWEMYIQLHLNELRPDLALLNLKVGIAGYEIKDWSSTTIRRSIE